MLVSVNISAYNEQDYLPEIFESLKNQTYPLKNIEVVLVDTFDFLSFQKFLANNLAHYMR